MKRDINNVEIRLWRTGDDVVPVTKILNKSYAQLADLGFRYVATWQGDEVTRSRLESGFSYLAFKANHVVGTITLREPPNVSGCCWYDRGDVASFGQFGVDPAHQNEGVGTLLIETVEAKASEMGIPNMALDTAEGAHHLIQLYEAKGYKFSGYADWDKTNYRSVILNKSI